MAAPAAPALILASASPRRRVLLARLCPAFTVAPSGIAETLSPGPPVLTVPRLALAKARAVAAGRTAGVVLGADTVVVIDGEILGKPADAADARRMLRRLRGRLHEVVTGLAALDAATGRAETAAAVTGVLMADYPEARLEAYAASSRPLDLAGGYAIQDLGGALVDAVVGSYTNVVGLPLAETARLLTAFGVPVRAGSGP